MIEYLQGRCVATYDQTCVINVSGVGYGVEVPQSLIQTISHSSGEVELWIYTKVREDALKLYGFSSLVEKQVFEVLVGISGVGPKVALGIMNTLSFQMILTAISMEDPKIFATCPGVGKRLSEKILVELKPKLEKLRALTMTEDLSDGLFLETGSKVQKEKPSTHQLPVDIDVMNAAESALTNLGFQTGEVRKCIQSILKTDSTLDEQELIRQSLVALNKGTFSNNARDHRHLF